MNEPDSMHIAWEGSGGKPGARELYLSTLDALHELVPDGLLYVLEGARRCGHGWTPRGLQRAGNVPRKWVWVSQRTTAACDKHACLHAQAPARTTSA